jgi:hypothetical protein
MPPWRRSTTRSLSSPWGAGWWLHEHGENCNAMNFHSYAGGFQVSKTRSIVSAWCFMPSNAPDSSWEWTCVVLLLSHMQCFRFVYIKFPISHVLCASWGLVPLYFLLYHLWHVSNFCTKFFRLPILWYLSITQQRQCFSNNVLLLQQLSKCVFNGSIP